MSVIIGGAFEAAIRQDATERVLKTLEDNLLLTSVLGVGNTCLTDEVMDRIRALRAKLNPGEAPALSRNLDRSPVTLMDLQSR